MTSPIAITAMGCIGSPGAGLSVQRAALRAGQSCLQQIALDHLPLSAHMPLGVVNVELPTDLYRNAALALNAATEALHGIGRSQRKTMGLIIGTSTGGMGPSEQVYLNQGPEALDPAYRQQQMHCVSRMVAARLAIGGPQSTHSVACVSAACAIIEAMNWLRSGLVESCLVVGCDANVRLTCAGFSSLQLVDNDGCRPLTVERNGMNLGEGAGAILLETPGHAKQRNAPILASLCGWGLRADGYHPTSPDPEATQLRRAISDCLSDAAISADELDWINAHGTGTRDNDATEATAFAALAAQAPVSSIKRIYGHTMGAAAAIEAVACVLALRHQERYASVGNEGNTPIAGLNLQRNYESCKIGAVLSTSLAFGGMNAALVFAGAERCI